MEKVRADLRGWNLGRAMFVADSGMNSEGNRNELAKACGKYLLACRMANVAEIKRDVLSNRGPYTLFQDNLQAKEFIVGDGERNKRYILCYNPKEARRQKKHRHKIRRTLEALQVTEFFKLNHRVLMRNELPHDARNIFKS